MKQTSNYLFIYGTLMNVENEYAAFLKSNSTFYAEGKLKGKLYDIGEYPGATPSMKKNEFVYGSVMQLNDEEAVLPIVDEYEGFGTGQLQPNEFIRVLTDVETAAGIINCWTYLYNLPVDNLPQIVSGRYFAIDY